ncbi:MAG: hypothetical protein ACTHU7_15450, partial [Microbacterium sp.]
MRAVPDATIEHLDMKDLHSMNHSTSRSIRRSLALLAASALAISLAACSSPGSGTDAAADERPVVLTTFTVLA